MKVFQCYAPFSPDETECPQGNHSFEVIHAIEFSLIFNTLCNGYNYLKLKLLLSDEYILHDEISNYAPHKLKSFCVSSSLMDKYHNGEIDAIDCLGKRGKAIVEYDTESDNKSPRIKEYLPIGDDYGI